MTSTPASALPSASLPPLPFGQPDFGDEEIAAVTRVLRSGWVGMGPETIAFENELAAWVEAPRVISVSSCTAALFLSLLVEGVTAGDEVVCPSLTWCSTANAALYLGATPVFCDIAPETLCSTPESLLAAVTPRTRAVIVVHYGGLAVDVEALRNILPEGIAIIEDAAHAIGARYPNGRPVGSSGNLVCYSFYANKTLSTAEGGAIALPDGERAERLASLRQHGLPSNAWRRYSMPKSALLAPHLTELGYKCNYTDLQAAIGRVQLRRQPKLAARRLAVAEHYVAALAERWPGVHVQADILSPDHARHLFVAILPADATIPRDELVRRCREQGIGLSIHYPPLHRMPLYGTRPPLPVTEAVSDHIVTFPISAAMTVTDAHRAFDVIWRASQD